MPSSSRPIVLILALFALLGEVLTPSQVSAASRPVKVLLPKTPLTIALDPGHGGMDPGAVHYNSRGIIDLKEKDVTLATALILAADLRAAGYHVVLTRTTDTAVNEPPRDLNGDHTIDNHDELQARVNTINASHAVLFVSLHDNAAEDPAVEGPTTFYSSSRPFAAKNRMLAMLCHSTLLRAFAARGLAVHNNGVIDENLETISPYHYFLLGPASPFTSHPTQVPGIIAESLYVTNPQDAQLLTQTSTLRLIAAAYTQGINAYLTSVHS